MLHASNACMGDSGKYTHQQHEQHPHHVAGVAGAIPEITPIHASKKYRSPVASSFPPNPILPQIQMQSASKE